MSDQVEAQKDGANDHTDKSNKNSRDGSPIEKNKPKIGDTRPAPIANQAEKSPSSSSPKNANRKRRKRRKSRSSEGRNKATEDNGKIELDEANLRKRRGQERKGKAVGRYTMAVHVEDGVTQIATLEGRSLLEFFVSQPANDISEIHGNVYLGKVENVLPGMEAAFVDIGTPKNAVLYQSDLVPSDQADKKTPSRI